MGIRKYAALAVLEAEIAPKVGGLERRAHRAVFDYEPRPGYLYVRSRAISSRTNDNFDTFPADDIKVAYRTFVGKPVFVNHHNETHKRARGVVVDAALHEDVLADGQPDTWVEVLMEVDALRFPKLAEAILKDEVDRTSMGCDVEYSICSVCGNRAETPLQYCAHIPKMKGARIVRRNAATGRQEQVLVHEICHGLKFFENSLLVEDPADPTALLLGVDDRGLRMAASKAENLFTARVVFDDDVKARVKRHNGQRGHHVVGWVNDGGAWWGLCPSCGSVNFSDPAQVAGLGQINGTPKTAATQCDGYECTNPPTTTREDSRGPQGEYHFCDRCARNYDYVTERNREKARLKEQGVDLDRENAEERRHERRVSSKTAIPLRPGSNEIPAPTQVDTLREATCPVCGETDAYNGEQCEVCGFAKPPDMFMDPDTDKAKEVDLREDTKEDMKDPGGYDPPPGATPDDEENAVGTGDYEPPAQARVGARAKGAEVAMGMSAIIEKLTEAQNRIEAAEAAANTALAGLDNAGKWAREITAALQEEHSGRVAAQAKVARLEQALTFVAKMGGMEAHVAKLLRVADEQNPANPIPEPASAAGTATTDEARAPDSTTTVTEPGASPETNTAPAASTDVTAPGATPATDVAPDGAVDVTAPVSGTQDQRPLGETKVETDVRVGNPMQTDTMNPWTLSKRTTAAIHLARLRIAADLATGDDLALGQAIVDDPAVSNEMIAHDIEMLENVAKASARRVIAHAAQPETITSTGRRTMPSLASAPEPPPLPQRESGFKPSDDEFLFE